ncbi:hypothetical protein K435DRAFT_964244 [Dendrothele bispora CBS 962.96]|uniref:Uncharacterized protein n=1 Tax=Dendrothele bispora (strain CBS 962.96) TaxID=1314807 RepID=A0A4S8MD62_DENBC|nr:hypothetical protein K435DRAFT_964244 [Dendrothele bispora CBS 962.96]
MFSKFALAFGFVSALAGSVLAAPLSTLDRRTVHSFDNWGGFSSLSGFDNFYGSENFCGVIQEQTIVEQQEVLVCHSVEIEIVQQRLLVLQEMAKRIITEQICEVETQTIVFQQFIAASSSFSSDLLHVSGHHVGYDSSIVGHYGNLIDESGSLTTTDLGFSGLDAGKNVVVVGGSNWNDGTSPFSVRNAYNAAQMATFF